MCISCPSLDQCRFQASSPAGLCSKKLAVVPLYKVCIYYEMKPSLYPGQTCKALQKMILAVFDKLGEQDIFIFYFSVCFYLL